MEEYDIAVIGAGPAGLMAAIYASRYRMRTIIFGDIYGGTMSEADLVANFPSYYEIKGFELMQKMVEQAEKHEITRVFDRVSLIEKREGGFLVKSPEKEVLAKKIILATGTKRRRLGLAREKELMGKGISYCATCDGPFFVGKTVAVVGGSDSALSIAAYLATLAAKVYIIYRKGEFFRAEPVWVELVDKNQKIEKVFNANVKELLGEKTLQKVKLDTGKEIELDGLFIEIGSEPDFGFLKMTGVKTDEHGYVIVDNKMRTSVKGIFSAGDLNSDNFKQAVVAVSEGSIAADTAHDEIEKEKRK